MNAQPAGPPLMTIGDVLGLLRPEFPDITISKIRFLEAEGLIEPQRSPSGYRKFGEHDLARLRFILAAQRDHYLPLRVIRRRLEALDRGDPAAAADRPGPARPRTLVAAPTAAPAPGPPAAPEDPAGGVRLTRRQLLDGAGVDEDLLAELETYGLVRRSGTHYDGAALVIARTVAELGEHGLQPRNLRAVKAAADRQADLIEQVVAPGLRRRSPGAHEEAAETARRIAELAVRLHTALLQAGLDDSLGR
ncbi:transcriptional regulator FtsR [Actinomadura parmotrematis]|uniref:MerR family transcriptional regulator n=1 Tax=Actinomadura parmotrematis TaxID=2864039 RepID=A0ABS7FR21_9ACTN|nr:MerR family transcriptional regulator [Actinomadura parmotrematis]MBW8482806.1 MerR family transcriptional regulator [Actinomadura parmotrematis]